MLKHLRTAELKPYVVFVKPPSLERLNETRKSAKVISGKDDKNSSKPFSVIYTTHSFDFSLSIYHPLILIGSLWVLGHVHFFIPLSHIVLGEIRNRFHHLLATFTSFIIVIFLLDLANRSWFSALTCACVCVCAPRVHVFVLPLPWALTWYKTHELTLHLYDCTQRKHMKSINRYTRPLPCPTVSLCYVCVRICVVSNDFPRVQLLPVYLAVCLHQGQARLLQDKWPQEPDTTTRRDGLMPIVAAETFYVKCG